jgi:serine/threonine protein kinase
VDKTTGRLVAVKRMNNKNNNNATTSSSTTSRRKKKKKNQDNNDNDAPPPQQSNTNGEVQALLHLDRAGGHPNICSLVGYYPNDDNGGTTYLVLELVEGCEMFDHLVNQGAYSEYDASRLVREVGSALAYLHGVGVIHMDLKPENIMLNSLNPSNAVVKLIDFGCAVVMTTTAAAMIAKPTPLLGRTLAYCPPEVLEGSDDAASPSADMYALGTFSILFLLFWSLPWQRKSSPVVCFCHLHLVFHRHHPLHHRYHSVHYVDGHSPVRPNGSGDRCRSGESHLSTSPPAVA